MINPEILRRSDNGRSRRPSSTDDGEDERDTRGYVENEPASSC